MGNNTHPLPRTTVSLLEAIADRGKAIIHSVFGLHKTCNPFKLYFDKLTATMSSKIEYLNLSLNNTKVNVDNYNKSYEKMSTEALNRRIASLELEVSARKADISEAENMKLFREEEFSNAYNKALTRYEQWHEALGRPPYFEIFDYKSLFKLNGFNKTDSSGSVDDDKPSIINWALKQIKKYIAGIFCVAYPMEIYFALPAFQFITPENKHAAIAGASILVGSLAFLGYCTGSLLLRSRINTLSICEGAKITPKNIKSTPNIFNASLLAVVVSVSLTIVLTGTALRTMIYDYERNIDYVKELNDKIKTLNDERDTSIANTMKEHETKLSQDISESQKLRTAALEARDRLRYQSLIPSTADGYLALSIYLALYLAPALYSITRRDPYPEYHLNAVEANELNDTKHMREIDKYNYIQAIKFNFESTKKELEEYKKEQDMREQSPKHKPEQDTESIINRNIKSYQDMLSAWRTQRMCTYFTTYMLLRGRSVRKELGDKAEEGFTQ